jgi:hypothetical protein
MDLRLSGAVFAGATQEPNGPLLLLQVTREAGVWWRVIGIAGSFNTAAHTGWITDARISADNVTLDLELNVYGDAWVPGGRAAYKVTLARKPGDQFEGEYTGTFKGVAVKGTAQGTLLPAQVAPANFRPIEQGEHPRILFRKADLPALKARMKTPFGQAMLARMTDAIGLGMQYQLTGDRKYAEQSWQGVESILLGGGGGIQTPYDHHGMIQWGPIWEEVAVSYDLCYEAWSAGQRKQAERYLVLWADRLYYQRIGFFNTQGQYDFGNSDEGSWLFYGVALGGLALWGEKGSAPVKPVPYDEVTSVAPTQGYQPETGTPVVKLNPGSAPDRWIYTKPIPSWADGDPLAGLGGSAQARPTAATAFEYEGAKYVFEPLPSDFKSPDGGVLLNVAKSIRPNHQKSLPGPEMVKDGPFTLCLYTVLDNATPCVVKVNAGGTRWGTQQFILNGKNLANGQAVKLDKGLYPLLVVMRVKARWNSLSPKLDAATESDIEADPALFARLRQDYADQLRDWDRETAEWTRSGGASPDYRRVFELTRWGQYQHYREGFGSGAAQSDTSGKCDYLGLWPGRYADAYRNCFGTDVSPYPDITHFLARRVWAHAYPETGAPLDQEVNGPNDPLLDYFPIHYRIVPDQWKPAIVWAWHRKAGVTNPSEAPKAAGGIVPAMASVAFVTYPLDTAGGGTSVKPHEPKGILPLTWEAPDFGYYGMRNGWEGANDFIAQVYGKCHIGHGYTMPNAGAFALMGLGHEWAATLPSLRLHNQRTFANVVLLPDDEINPEGNGRVTYARFQPDGSGAVTFDLNDIYAMPANSASGKNVRQYEKYGGTRNPAGFADSGITGLRSFAVDYSGKSGAPCLFVVVDKITGGKGKVWAWRVPGAKQDEKGRVSAPGDLDKVTVQGQTVAIAHPDANLRMTFAAPAKVDIKAENRSITYTKTYNRGEGQMPAPGIYASGADPKEGFFFVVATVQAGPPPEVKVDGAGEATRIRVGKRVISFDGAKVNIGD